MSPCCASCEKAEMQALARRYLARLGKSGHPDAERDPVGALGQVAVDLQQALNLRVLGRDGMLDEARRQALASAKAAVLAVIDREVCPYSETPLPNPHGLRLLAGLAIDDLLPAGPPDPPPPAPGRTVA